MSKINEYPQAVTINNNDLFVIDQESGGDHATKSASVAQIAEKATEEVNDKIGDLSQLTTSDKSSLVGAVNEIARYTPVYGNTASGAIATFDTSLALPLQDCTIDINAVQEGSGTPSPDNVRPITGFSSANVSVSGVNPWDEQWELGTYDAEANTVIKLVDNIHIRSKNPIRVVPNHTYYMNSAGKNAHLIVADANGNVLYRTITLNNGTFTTPADSAFVYFNMSQAYGTTYNNDISINYQSSDTQYHAFNGNTYPVSLGQTVYGGLLDVTTGLLTVTYAIDTFNSFTLSGYELNGYRMTNTLSHTPKAGYGNFLCNCFTRATSYADAVGSVKNSICYTSSGVILLNYYKDGSYVKDITALNSALPTEGCKIAYELATPQTIQLTPTQISAIVGTNNVFTDTNGDTSVVYACSLKDYIEGQ